MSALTKVFIILLVVCSLLFTAATVVFVNRVEDFRTMANNSDAAKVRAEQRARVAEEAAAAATARAQEQINDANARIAAKNTELLQAQQSIADKNAQLAQADTRLKMAQLDAARLTEALKSSETTKTQQMAQITDLRAKVDELTAKSLDLNTAVADLTNTLDQTERERKFMAEQVVQLQADNAKLTGALKDSGVKVEQVTALPAPAGLKAGAPAINGVVRQVRTIVGIPYATISVGSADSVTKGMEFKIIDRDRGDFLGVLTIDSVEPNEAVGKLTGPKIQNVRPGNEVRTQL